MLSECDVHVIMTTTEETWEWNLRLGDCKHAFPMDRPINMSTSVVEPSSFFAKPQP